MREPIRRAATFTVLVALYVAAGGYSTLLIDGPGQVALFWPASGIALAGVVRYGLRWAPFVPAGGLLVHLLFDPVPLTFLPW
jgi:integral membrane sensor domain MASE1